MNKAISIILSCITLALFPINRSMADSNSFHQLGALWWEWVLSFPASEYPPHDTTGDDCMIGQRGDLWFLAGTESGKATRNCSVPEGVSLFFPVYNFFSLDAPGACGQPIDAITPIGEMRAFVKEKVNTAINLVVELDGKPIKMQRSATAPFKVAFPKDNIFAEACAGEPGGLPASVYSPGVADGYWSLIHSIRDLNGDDRNPATFEIDHVLHIHAEEKDNPGFVVDVVYNLDVVPVRLR